MNSKIKNTDLFINDVFVYDKNEKNFSSFSFHFSSNKISTILSLDDNFSNDLTNILAGKNKNFLGSFSLEDQIFYSKNINKYRFQDQIFKLGDLYSKKNNNKEIFHIIIENFQKTKITEQNMQIYSKIAKNFNNIIIENSSTLRIKFGELKYSFLKEKYDLNSILINELSNVENNNIDETIIKHQQKILKIKNRRLQNLINFYISISKETVLSNEVDRTDVALKRLNNDRLLSKISLSQYLLINENKKQEDYILELERKLEQRKTRNKKRLITLVKNTKAAAYLFKEKEKIGNESEKEYFLINYVINKIIIKKISSNINKLLYLKQNQINELLANIESQKNEMVYNLKRSRIYNLQKKHLLTQKLKQDFFFNIEIFKNYSTQNYKETKMLVDKSKLEIQENKKIITQKLAPHKSIEDVLKSEKNYNELVDENNWEAKKINSKNNEKSLSLEMEINKIESKLKEQTSRISELFDFNSVAKESKIWRQNLIYKEFDAMLEKVHTLFGLKNSIINSKEIISILNTENIYKAIEMLDINDSIFNKTYDESTNLEKFLITLLNPIAINTKFLIYNNQENIFTIAEEDKIFEYFKKVNSKNRTTFLCFNPYLENVRKHSDEIIIEHNGKRIEHGKKSEILKNPIHPVTKKIINDTDELDLSEISNNDTLYEDTYKVNDDHYLFTNIDEYYNLIGKIPPYSSKTKLPFKIEEYRNSLNFVSYKKRHVNNFNIYKEFLVIDVK